MVSFFLAIKSFMRLCACFRFSLVEGGTDVSNLHLLRGILEGCTSITFRSFARFVRSLWYSVQWIPVPPILYVYKYSSSELNSVRFRSGPVR